MLGTSTDVRWRVRPVPQLLMRRWSGQLIVFDSFSGNTHLFDRVALAGFDCLQQRAADQQELCQAMAKSLDVEADQDLARYAGELLLLLKKLGLVEAVAR